MINPDRLQARYASVNDRPFFFRVTTFDRNTIFDRKQLVHELLQRDMRDFRLVVDVISFVDDD